MRIEDYGLIGDLQTAALVGRNGSIDWLCFPRFDSGACFAALLGSEGDGRWLLAPDCEVRRVERRYRERSLIHELDFHTDSGVVRVIDFMPPRGTDPDIVRIVEGIEGSVPMLMEFVLRFDYGSIVPWVRHVADNTRIAVAGPDAVSLQTPVEVRGENMRTVGEFTVSAGDRLPFVLTWFPSHHDTPQAIDPESALEDTVSFWDEWVGRCGYGGRWRDAVLRSLMVLKAMTYEPTGGIVAAPTTSLPEHIGGVRNWDYRYCWLRDATFALHALVANGFLDEARAWRRWLLRAVAGDPDDLQIMYGAGGRAAAHRARAAVARRLRGVEAGPDRQRREQPVPARRLRRGARRAPRRAQREARAGRGLVDAAEGPARRRSSGAGTSPTRGSGRSAARAATSRTRR